MTVASRALSLRRRVERQTAPYRRAVLHKVGRPARRDWARSVMNERIEHRLASLPLGGLDALEVSGHLHADRPFRTYQSWSWPDFDVCEPYRGDARFDVVICEQVLEHVIDPVAAARTLRSLLRPGGFLLVSTPFLLRIHEEPGDYWRFTAAGLTVLLERAGLQVEEVGSWGNRACVRANFTRWVPSAWWRSLVDEPEFPVVVWAFATV